MDASEYKNYLLGLIFYKYLSDKLLQTVVTLADESLEEYDTPTKQTELYKELLEDEDSRQDLVDTLVDTLSYDIEPDYLFSSLAEQAKQNVFQLDDLKKPLFIYLQIINNLMVYLMMLIYNRKIRFR